MHRDIRNSGTRVLIADEDTVRRHGLASLLTRQGFEVIAVVDGGEAYRVLQSDSNFKCAIFGSDMANINSLDLVRHMRTEKRLMRIPVMMITAEKNLSLLADTLSAGVTLLLSEPFTPPSLQNALQLMLSDRKYSVAVNSPVPIRLRSLCQISSLRPPSAK